MKKKIFILLTLLPFFVKAQEGYIIPYDFNKPGAIISDLLLDDDSIIVCGLASPGEPQFVQSLFWAKLDTFGNILNVKFHFDELERDYVLGGFPSGLIKAKDNSGYLIAGGVFQSATGVVLKLDNDGELVWKKEYEDSLSRVDFYRDIVEIKDGYLILGQKQALDYNSNIFVMKINEEGEKLWERVYRETNNRGESFGDITVINDNEYVVGGTMGPILNTPWEEYEATLHIFAIDSLGEQKWYWERDPSLDEVWLLGLNRNSDSNWIYATTRIMFEFDGTVRRQPRVIVRDSNFEIVKEHDLDDFGWNVGHYLANLVPLSNGDFLGVGSSLVYVEEPIIAQSHVRTWMTRMNMEGDTLWERKDLVFPDTLVVTIQYLHSAVELPGGSVIAAGYYDAHSDLKHWGILIKVDRNGCIDTINCNPISGLLEEQLSEKNLEEVHVYPNPAHSTIYLHNEHHLNWDLVELFDIAGRKVKQERQTSTLDVRSLPQGIYYLRIWLDNNYIVKEVIIE